MPRCSLYLLLAITSTSRHGTWRLEYISCIQSGNDTKAGRHAKVAYIHTVGTLYHRGGCVGSYRHLSVWLRALSAVVAIGEARFVMPKGCETSACPCSGTYL